MSLFKKQNQRVFDQYRAGKIMSDRKYYPYGKENNVESLTDQQITEMSYGFFKDKKALLTGDYFLDMTKVTGVYCTLKDLSFIKRPTQEDYTTQNHKTIGNIRTFFFQDYFLLTEEPVYHQTEHRITKNLLSAGAFLQANATHRGLNRIFNKNQKMQKFPKGYVPVDLFAPIKYYINEFFFEDPYWIDDFFLETGIEIKLNTKIENP